MAFYCMDSSGLVKRYITKVGSTWVQELTHPAAGNQICVVQITGVEVVAAIARRQRQGSSSAEEAATVIADFQADFSTTYYSLDVDAALVVVAMEMAEKHGLRGYDAVQLAGALDLCSQCRIFGLPDPIVVSADVELNSAAAREGLAVDNPNSHA